MASFYAKEFDAGANRIDLHIFSSKEARDAWLAKQADASVAACSRAEFRQVTLHLGHTKHSHGEMVYHH